MRIFSPSLILIILVLMLLFTIVPISLAAAQADGLREAVPGPPVKLKVDSQPITTAVTVSPEPEVTPWMALGDIPAETPAADPEYVPTRKMMTPLIWIITGVAFLIILLIWLMLRIRKRS